METYFNKYQFSNAPPDTSVERFAQMSCNAREKISVPGVDAGGVSRYWIERAFEDGNGIAVASRIIRYVNGTDDIII